MIEPGASLTSDAERIQTVAAAIANARAARRGAPAVSNVLEMLQQAVPRLHEQVMDEGRAVIEALDKARDADLETAMKLLDRAGELLNDTPMPSDPNWWRDYLTFVGGHWIRSEEGWEPGSALQEYRQLDPDWKPLEEIGGVAAKR